MKSMKRVIVLVIGAALCFAGGVFAAAAKKEMALTPAADVKWAPLDPKQPEGAQMSVVFGDMAKKGPLGVLLKFPPGATPGPHTHTSDYWGVVIKGTEHNFAGDNKGPGLGPGSHWFQPGKGVHNNECEPGSECVVFLYLNGKFDFAPAPEAKAGGEMKK